MIQTSLEVSIFWGPVEYSASKFAGMKPYHLVFSAFQTLLLAFQVAIAKYNRLVVSTTDIYFFRCFGGESSEWKVLSEMVSFKASLLGVQMTANLCLAWSSLCVSVF